VSRKSVITAHAQWLVKRNPFREGVAMKAMTIDSTPAARRISALRSSVRNLEEALGSILDVVGNDDYPLDENARDELMRLIGPSPGHHLLSDYRVRRAAGLLPPLGL
jgi:hypothetical protein